VQTKTHTEERRETTTEIIRVDNTLHNENMEKSEESDQML